VAHDFGTGCLLSVPFGIVWLLIALAVTVGGWIAVMLTLYLRQHPQHPRFARGFGYCLVALLISLVSVSGFCSGL
jgi:hypothetical protein